MKILAVLVLLLSLLFPGLLPAPAGAAAPLVAQRAVGSTGGDLREPSTKEVAMQLVSSAENSSLDWRAQYRYIEDIGDGRGYTAGIIGFCSGTGDMLELVEAYTAASPANPLARFLPALRKVDGTDSHRGLGRRFVRAWRAAASDPVFTAAQDAERDRVYLDPAVSLAQADGLGALGQFAYYDAAVVHGPSGLRQIRKRALRRADPPAAGGPETTWLGAFLRERLREMKEEPAHAEQLDRITQTQRRFLAEGNLGLVPPLRWRVNQTGFHIDAPPTTP